ncbi:protein phosphatase 2C domain-containing protein [Besnoitia besnoiti]|uniref:Protein phosphatase 2C domain-containing protein n=1 Tax=Besnoitia besnoiti TaxID=94643 RepID=A0A2A9M0D2_BESBE|nr:protein phosphatase 2C domain-containing protein [Besnoitia besnoiti]PFH31409.1 protein phosphatase 2C domain-containing protein [Besnoitia besnoiti]
MAKLTGASAGLLGAAVLGLFAASLSDVGSLLYGQDGLSGAVQVVSAAPVDALQTGGQERRQLAAELGDDLAQALDAEALLAKLEKLESDGLMAPLEEVQTALAEAPELLQTLAAVADAVNGSDAEEGEVVNGSDSEDEEAVKGSDGEEGEVVNGSDSEDEEAVKGSDAEDEEVANGSDAEDGEAVSGSDAEEGEVVDGSDAEDEEAVNGSNEGGFLATKTGTKAEEEGDSVKSGENANDEAGAVDGVDTEEHLHLPAAFQAPGNETSNQPEVPALESNMPEAPVEKPGKAPEVAQPAAKKSLWNRLSALFRSLTKNGRSKNKHSS